MPFKYESLIFIVLILLLTASTSGCGLGYRYTSYEDKVVIIDENNVQYFKKEAEKLVKHYDYTIDKISGNKVYVVNKYTEKRTGNNYGYLLIPFPLPRSGVDKQTEYYLDNDELCKVIYRNGATQEKGFGFFCSPLRNYWGGTDSWCQLLP